MRSFLTYILFSLFALSSFGAKVQFTAKTSHQVVEVGQRFQITFTVNSRGGNFTPPDFNDFRLLGGPNQSQSMQYINGQVSHSTSLSYILAATEEGTFTIGAASITVDGESYETNPIEIKVVEASDNSANAQRNRQQQRKSSGDKLSDHVFIRAVVDKNEAYVGEKVSVTFKLYSKLGLSGLNLEKLPALNGFWSHQVKSVYDQIQLDREMIDGEIYNVAELQQTVLYPQRSGDLTIDPLEMKVSVNVRSRRSRSVFEQMFGSYERKELIVASSPINIKVKSLPLKGKPVDFSGAVGSFNMRLSSNKNQLKANEAIDIKISLEGKGNLPLLSAPDLNFPPDFEVYDPEMENKYSINYNGASGAKVFKYLVIPRHAGEYFIEPYKFTYFDLNSKTYKTISSDSIRLQVAKGEDSANAVYQANRKESVELLNKDIRYIHTQGIHLLSENEFFYQSVLFYSLIILAILLAVLFYFFVRKRKEKLKDQSGLRRSKANKLAKKRLKTAKKHLDQNEQKAFYEEISEALYGYYADKLNISIADLSQERIIERLNVEGGEAIKSQLIKVLEDAEMARFAPSSSINDQALYDSAVEIISQTESLNL